MKQMNKNFMLEAINLSVESVMNGGGPFGAVIVKDGEIIASGSNSVSLNNDPTAHAEVVAIRNACSKLGTFDLSGCEIYTSCEPCPMCLGAIYWSHLGKVYFGNNRIDAMNAGFDDSLIYNELGIDLDKRKIPFQQVLKEEAHKAFDLWLNTENRIKY